MTTGSLFIHSLEGRLRLKIPQVKGAAAKALEIEAHLRHFTGVESVSANPVTGSVLILYDSSLIDQGHLISIFKESGYLSPSPPEAVSAPGIVKKVTTTVTAGLMEVALTRLVAALI
jgi:copper chaperone CopZ